MASYGDRPMIQNVFEAAYREAEIEAPTPRISDHIEACHQGMSELEKIVQECINRAVGMDPRPSNAECEPLKAHGAADNMTRVRLLSERIADAIGALNVVRERL